MSNQIRILVDCHVFDGTFQGTTTYLKGIYSKLILDKNFHFHLASNNSEFLKTIFGIHDNVTYLDYKFTSKYYRLIIGIPSIVKKYHIDFAHFQYIVPPFKSCRYIVTIHDILFMDYPQYFPLSYRIKYKYLFKWSAMRSDIVLTVSSFSKERIQKYFKINDILITPNAVNPIYFEDYDKKDVKNEICIKYGLKDYWIYISRWEPRKNHLSLLKVFVENEYHRNYSLVFVGNDAIENKEYRRYFESLTINVKSKVVSLKNIDFREGVLLLRGADLSVYPSVAEGFGIPPLEALAAKIPSICSNTTGMSDYTFMKSMRFDPDDLENMKNCIEENLNSRPDTYVLDQLKKTYNWEKSAMKIKYAIENII
ncbi:Glycosyltransferase involved in cell wall bisynthesis [Flavobacteriaceae bacterium MAR_2010_188]|nr:Glycosyltransferase involved in cell wall bisynthesis [Flavobacteriaceae bacterium MAR_2010_188]